MIVHVTDIEWDIDDILPTEELPKNVDLEFDDLCTSFLRNVEDSVCEILEEKYGFCVANFCIDI